MSLSIHASIIDRTRRARASACKHARACARLRVRAHRAYGHDGAESHCTAGRMQWEVFLIVDHGAVMLTIAECVAMRDIIGTGHNGLYQLKKIDFWGAVTHA